jgi:hypothetical protein
MGGSPSDGHGIRPVGGREQHPQALRVREGVVGLCGAGPAVRVEVRHRRSARRRPLRRGHAAARREAADAFGGSESSGCLGRSQARLSAGLRGGQRNGPSAFDERRHTGDRSSGCSILRSICDSSALTAALRISYSRPTGTTKQSSAVSSTMSWTSPHCYGSCSTRLEALGALGRSPRPPQAARFPSRGGNAWPMAPQ